MAIADVFDKFPVLETERLVLRRIRLADTDALFALYSDERVAQFLDIGTFTERQQAEDLAAFFVRRYEQDHFSIRWAITLRDYQHLIGTCGFNYFDHDSQWSEIGYELLPAFWGRGLMSEALRAVLHYGFTTAALHRIEAVVAPNNQPSIRLLERLGFQREGILRERLFSHGHYLDSAFYGLLQREYQKEVNR